MKKTNFASRSLVLLLTVLLALSLTACNTKGGEKMDNMGGGMSAMMDARMAKNWHGSLWRIALTAEAGRHHRLSIKISKNNFAKQE